jgi:hypothetical protein
MSEGFPEPTQEVLDEMERSKRYCQVEDARREGVSKMRDMIMKLVQSE